MDVLIFLVVAWLVVLVLGAGMFLWVLLDEWARQWDEERAIRRHRRMVSELRTRGR